MSKFFALILSNKKSLKLNSNLTLTLEFKQKV